MANPRLSWLKWEDSNSQIPDNKIVLKLRGNFAVFSPKVKQGPGTCLTPNEYLAAFRIFHGLFGSVLNMAITIHCCVFKSFSCAA
jgi:hypothetical protein